jgi:outer membrane protein OmpA-like peptidoglycan-associated protein
MLILKDTIYHTKAIAGFGVKKEFDGNELANKIKFEEEKNSIWYFITAPIDGVFTFDIITENKNDDWDFLLFEYKKAFCKRLEDNVINPIRSNLSRSPITGLSRKGKESFVGAGVSANYSRPIRVKKGDRYVLVVNNPKRAGGKHTLILHYPQKKKIIVEKEAPIAKDVVTKTRFKLKVKDKVTKKLVPSFITISGLKKTTIDMDTTTVYETEIIRKNHLVILDASAKGYMLISESFKVAKNEVDYLAEIFLEKIEPGKKVNLKNIQFYGNRYDFLPKARSSLKALLSFMNQNPSVAIEVEGHVNGPGQKNSKDYQELSYNRAYAVKAYLIKNGVDKGRIDFKGFGNSKMLYPNPKSPYQESANRRVEIKITSNEYYSGDRNFH